MSVLKWISGHWNGFGDCGLAVDFFERTKGSYICTCRIRSMDNYHFPVGTTKIISSTTVLGSPPLTTRSSIHLLRSTSQYLFPVPHSVVCHSRSVGLRNDAAPSTLIISNFVHQRFVGMGGKTNIRCHRPGPTIPPRQCHSSNGRCVVCRQGRRTTPSPCRLSCRSRASSATRPRLHHTQRSHTSLLDVSTLTS